MKKQIKKDQRISRNSPSRIGIEARLPDLMEEWPSEYTIYTNMAAVSSEVSGSTRKTYDTPKYHRNI